MPATRLAACIGPYCSAIERCQSVYHLEPLNDIEGAIFGFSYTILEQFSNYYGSNIHSMYNAGHFLVWKTRFELIHQVPESPETPSTFQCFVKPGEQQCWSCPPTASMDRYMLTASRGSSVSRMTDSVPPPYSSHPSPGPSPIIPEPLAEEDFQHVEIGEGRVILEMADGSAVAELDGKRQTKQR